MNYISIAVLLYFLATNGEGSSGGSCNRRMRGRPRLAGAGPAHMGLRSTSSLPIALGSTLGSNFTTQKQ